MNISTDGLYFYFIKHENVASIDLYHKFLNWLSGEFDLHQKDEFDGLKVYYPEGWLSVKMINKKDDNVYTEIYVKCKSKKTGLETFQKIESIYCHLMDVYVKNTFKAII